MNHSKPACTWSQNESQKNIDQRLEKLKNRNGDKAIEASLSSIRALTNSRDWTLP